MRNRRGFTLIEILVSIGLTVIITLLVFMMYKSTMDTFRNAERELQWLAAFRSATDKMERELGSMAWKAVYLPAEGENTIGWQSPELKPINTGYQQIHFLDNYIAFYTSLDGQTVDRIEYYYNPPEKMLEWEDGLDNDNDDPLKGLKLLFDDKGSFMLRRVPADRLYYDQAAYDTAKGIGEFTQQDEDEHRYGHYEEDLSLIIPAFVIDPTLTEVDSGDILSDGISDVKFWYIYLEQNSTVFKYADRWPYDNDTNSANGDLTVLSRGVAPNRHGLSYLTPPLAIQVDFTFKDAKFTKKMSKTIYLHGSLWNKYMRDSLTGPP